MLGTEILPKGSQRYQELQKARATFKKDLEENPGYYIPAVSANLPFKSNYFDLILSHNCVGTLVAVDFQELEQSAAEIIRVLKPHGAAIIYPFDNRGFLDINQPREAWQLAANQQKLLRRLKRASHHYSIQGGHPFRRVTTDNKNRKRPYYS